MFDISVVGVGLNGDEGTPEYEVVSDEWGMWYLFMMTSAKEGRSHTLIINTISEW